MRCTAVGEVGGSACSQLGVVHSHAEKLHAGRRKSKAMTFSFCLGYVNLMPGWSKIQKTLAGKMAINYI